VVLVVAYFLCYGWSIYWTGWSFRRFASFLAEHPRIADAEVLARYKQLARTDMNLALMNIGVLVVGFVIGVVLVLRHGLVGLLLILAANGVLLAFGVTAKQAERRVKALPAANQELAGEKERVNQSWTKKALPDF
jgi:hypothetical protein